MRKLIVLLALSAMACGVQTQLTQAAESVVTDYQAPSPSAAPAPNGGQWMTVTAMETVYIRPSAGIGEEPIGALKNGQAVFVTVIEVIGDSFWCRHLQGWTNCRYLAANE